MSLADLILQNPENGRNPSKALEHQGPTHGNAREPGQGNSAILQNELKSENAENPNKTVIQLVLQN